MHRSALIAIGGNALMRAGEAPTITSERAHVSEVARGIARIVAEGWRVVLTHGNGPQVGAELLRSERAAGEAYPLPLDVCVACTQGEIGCLLQQALGSALADEHVYRPAVTVLTQVLVSQDDPAFRNPTKPIGPYYPPAIAAERARGGWTLVEVPPHGFRRVVPSPEPLQVVEHRAIRRLLDAGAVVIALGGGGVPVVRNGSLLRGVEAVVDKDLASALLAQRLGVDAFVVATDVDRVYLDHGLPHARGIDAIDASTLRRLAEGGYFPPGTMGPKVEALLRFVERGGRTAIVTSHDRLVSALQGHAGTRVVPAPVTRRATAVSPVWVESA
jgi:carbamate kinase